MGRRSQGQNLRLRSLSLQLCSPRRQWGLPSQEGNDGDPSLLDDHELAKTAGSPAFFAPELCLAGDPSYTLTPAEVTGKTGADSNVNTPRNEGAKEFPWHEKDEEADVQPEVEADEGPDVDASRLSEEATQVRDLLDRLMEKDPNKRIKLDEDDRRPSTGAHDFGQSTTTSSSSRLTSSSRGPHHHRPHLFFRRQVTADDAAAANVDDTKQHRTRSRFFHHGTDVKSEHVNAPRQHDELKELGSQSQPSSRPHSPHSMVPAVATAHGQSSPTSRQPKQNAASVLREISMTPASTLNAPALSTRSLRYCKLNRSSVLNRPTKCPQWRELWLL
ncbi:hypothetical protein L7F22_024744 [Adiantum nelumboides]|nr:hypothetical protein [Adiantum nelumboides]